jgi:thymidylate synthase
MTDTTKHHTDPIEPVLNTQYEDMMRLIRDHGRYKGDRTGTGTTSIFGHQLRYDLTKGFPLITTKKVATNAMIRELQWFLNGDTNVRWLQERGCNIWNEWADEKGDLGPVYGAQWRAWPGQLDMQVTSKGSGEDKVEFPLPENSTPVIDFVIGGQVGRVFQKPIDQISWVIDRLKTNPDCRRIIVSAWNVAELSKMALMPCHCLFQFYSHELTVDERAKLYIGEGMVGTWSLKEEDSEAVEAHMHKFLDEKEVPRRALSCQLYQRSCDVGLGVPFNIASYALLTHMVAQQVGMAVADFIWTGGDCHLYSNHKDLVETQLSREVYPFPTLKIKRKPDSIFDYELEDFEFENYRHHPAIKAPVAV